MKCDECGEEANPIFGFDGSGDGRKLMGHYCGKCILYKRETNGREKETRIIEQPKK